MAANDNTTDAPVNDFLGVTKQAADNGATDSVKEMEQNDPFWVHEEIDATRWNQAFPYQFILVKSNGNGQYVQDATTKKWTYTLPFPPEALTISTPFAVVGSVTQGGYVEEHNGAPTRTITLSGTTGVLPLRPRNDVRKDQNLAEAIFAGTIQQGARVAASVNTLTSNATGSNDNFAPHLVDDSAFTNPQGDTTGVALTSGYYQFRLLQNFFENYVSFKKTAAGRPYRLAFAAYKQQAVYLVTPQAYTVAQGADSPFEYTYNIGLRAWRRISLKNVKVNAANAFTPAVQKPNALQTMLNTLVDARAALAAATGIIAAVGGDLDHALFEPLRQLTMFVRDAVGSPLTFADLPVQVLNECQDAIVQYAATNQAFQGVSDSLSASTNKIVNAYKVLADLATATSKVDTGVALLSQTSGVGEAHPALDLFRNPTENFDFFSSIQVGQVQVPPSVVKAIAADRDRVRQLKRIDFESMRDGLVQVMADFADAVGAGNATYNATFQRASRPSSKTPTLDDFQVIFAMNRTILEVNRLAASGVVDNRLRSVDFVAGLAAQAGIAFTVPQSKFAVPYPYGVTLEQLATRYLGDPDRWMEIAALNGLRAPYVDEEGFDMPLLVDARNNDVSVADVSNLTVGQQVWVLSNNKTQTKRRVTRVTPVSAGNFVVMLDGDDPLDGYTTPQQARLHAFLPDTVNSMMTLYIPSSAAPATEDFQTKDIPGLDVFDELLNVGGVDLLLTSTNDLAITPDGDCRLAVGLANIVQTARIRLAVVQGTLNRHPEFGLPVKVGQSVADLDAKALLKAAQNLFNDDPAFTGVTSASVSVGGPSARIALTVGVRGVSQDIPLTLDVKR